MDINDIDNLLNNFETDLEDNLEAFEKDGANLTRPLLAEGYYPANFKEFTLRYGMTDKKNKSNPTGELRPWCSLGAVFTLDSAVARESLKQDNNPNVFTANETDFLPAFFNTNPLGFNQELNGQFWQLLGSILEQEGIAELRIEEGNKNYLINGEFIRAVYNNTYKEEVKRLYGLVKDGLPITDTEKTNYPELVPAMLAEVLLKNISELIEQQAEVRECAILVGRRVMDNSPSKEKQHYAKGYILRKDLAEFEEQLLK